MSIKKDRPKRTVFLIRSELFSLRCANRANTVASAAVDASVSVDNVLAVSLRNSANRAALSASAASDTLIRDLVSHNNILLIIFAVRYGYKPYVREKPPVINNDNILL